MWKDMLNEIIMEKKTYGEKVDEGLSQTEISFFADKFSKEFQTDFPSDYYDVLKTVNGLEFSGFILYGADVKQSENGLIYNNRIWHENGFMKEYVFLGESCISWYCYEEKSHRYYEIDRPSGTVMETFSGSDAMVEKILTDALL